MSVSKTNAAVDAAAYAQYMKMADNHLAGAWRALENITTFSFGYCSDAVTNYYEAAKRRRPDDAGRAAAGVEEVIAVIDIFGEKIAAKFGDAPNHLNWLKSQSTKIKNHAKASRGLLYVTGDSGKQDLGKARELFGEVAADMAKNEGRDVLVRKGWIEDNWVARSVEWTTRTVDFLRQASWELTHKGARQKDSALVNPEEVRILKELGTALRDAVKDDRTLLSEAPLVGRSYNRLAALFPNAQHG